MCCFCQLCYWHSYWNWQSSANKLKFTPHLMTLNHQSSSKMLHSVIQFYFRRIQQTRVLIQHKTIIVTLNTTLWFASLLCLNGWKPFSCDRTLWMCIWRAKMNQVIRITPPQTNAFIFKVLVIRWDEDPPCPGVLAFVPFSLPFFVIINIFNYF